MAIPIWIPKLAVPIGAGLLLVAVLDELLGVLRGGRPAYVLAAEARAAHADPLRREADRLRRLLAAPWLCVVRRTLSERRGRTPGPGAGARAWRAASGWDGCGGG